MFPALSPGIIWQYVSEKDGACGVFCFDGILFCVECGKSDI
jgi:hypothetical protein